MTDDLVKRLRKVEPDAPGERTRWYRNPDGPEAADRIESLEAGFQLADEKWSKISARCEQLEAALREIEMLHYDSETDFHHDAMKAHDIARAALGEKNGKDAKE